MSLEGPRIQLLSHPKAPLFDKPDSLLRFQQIFSEVASGNFPTTKMGEFYEHFRQAGYVSLYFFLRGIASYSGPYGKLSPSLHVDMGNFYQEAMYNGSKAAGFIGRAHFKSSVWTHGANTWELLRDPELHIGLACGLKDRAMEFLHYTQDTFMNNPLFEWLYPEYVPSDSYNQKGWTDEILTLPNKSFNKRKPNIKPITAGGSSAGIHVDLLKLDDIVDDSDLDSNRMASASMRKMGGWLKAAIRTLVMDWTTSRSFLSATRYAVDDAYEDLFLKCKNQRGYWDELPYDLNPEGEWDIYYRMLKEKGQIIFPENFTEAGLRQLQEDDPWVYFTQYENNPHAVGTSELSQFTLKECHLEDRQGQIFIHVTTEGGRTTKEVALADCDVVQVGDPAASEKGISARTSRSAHAIMALDPEGNYYIIQGHADYVAVKAIYEWFFGGWASYSRYLRMSGMEMRGPFKVFESLFREEQARRNTYINFRPIKTSGDKDARIRTALEGPLRKGKLYCVPTFRDKVKEELRTFPDGHKKDVLDAISMGISVLIQPDPPESQEDYDYREAVSQSSHNRVTGY